MASLLDRLKYAGDMFRTSLNKNVVQPIRNFSSGLNGRLDLMQTADQQRLAGNGANVRVTTVPGITNNPLSAQNQAFASVPARPTGPVQGPMSTGSYSSVYKFGPTAPGMATNWSGWKAPPNKDTTSLAAPAPQKTPEQLANEAALAALEKERQDIQYRGPGGVGEPVPPPTPTNTGTTGGGYGQGESGSKPMTIDEINAIMKKAREGENFLSEADIQKAEDARKSAIADAISRSYDLQDKQLLKENAQKLQGTSALYTNLAGGPANVASGTIEAVGEQMRLNDQAIADLEQKRIDALDANDIQSAQRVEDRLNQLADRKVKLDADYQDRLNLVEKSNEFSQNYKIDLGKLAVDQQNSVNDILKMQKSDALDAVKVLLSNFGSMATEGLSAAEVNALEYQAGLPQGSLMRQLQTIDEKKANQLQFVPGTMFEQPGSFNQNTGVFTPISAALRNEQQANGDSPDNGYPTSPEQAAQLIDAYRNSPDKSDFIANLSTNKQKGAASFLLEQPELSGMLTPATKDQRYAIAVTDFVNAAKANGGLVSKDEAQKFFSSRGIYDTTTDPAVSSVIKTYTPTFFQSLIAPFTGG